MSDNLIEQRGPSRLMFMMADQLVAQMLKVSGGPAAYRDADILALALKRIDRDLPRKVAESAWWR